MAEYTCCALGCSLPPAAFQQHEPRRENTGSFRRASGSYFQLPESFRLSGSKAHPSSSLLTFCGPLTSVALLPSPPPSGLSLLTSLSFLRFLCVLVLSCYFQNCSLPLPWPHPLSLELLQPPPKVVSPGCWPWRTLASRTPVTLSLPVQLAQQHRSRTPTVCFLQEQRQILPPRRILHFYLGFRHGKDSQRRT